ncbi:unnamed protein product, partial [Cyprideis torosa]
SSPKKGPLLGAGRRGLLGSTPEEEDKEGLRSKGSGSAVSAMRSGEALVTLASMADAEAAAAFLEHMSFSTGQIKVTFEDGGPVGKSCGGVSLIFPVFPLPDDRGGAMASRPPPSPPSPPPLPLSRPPPLLGRGEIASGHQEGPQDVLVGKLPFGTTRRQVEDLFQDFQPREVEVFSGDTGIYAYLSFMEREAAESAVRAWNGKRYGDTRLLVEMYKERGATGRRVDKFSRDSIKAPLDNAVCCQPSDERLMNQCWPFKHLPHTHAAKVSQLRTIPRLSAPQQHVGQSGKVGPSELTVHASCRPLQQADFKVKISISTTALCSPEIMRSYDFEQERNLR